MIDWITAVFPDVVADLQEGSVVSFLPDGSVDWMTEKSKQLQNTNDTSVQVGNSSRGLRISGNPSKWFQGHNAFGLDDWSLVTDFFGDIGAKMGLQLHKEKYSIRRIDITYSFAVDDVPGYLLALSQLASGKRQPVTSTGSTVYFGKNSQRSSVKFYDKFMEFKKNGGKSLSDKQFACLYQYMKQCSRATRSCTSDICKQGVMRVEVCIRGKALDELLKGEAWEKVNIRGLWEMKVQACNIPTEIELKQNDYEGIKTRDRLVYRSWREGEDIRHIFPRATAYRYRKTFLEKYGIDLFQRSPLASRARVIPLFRVLEARPVAIPADAYLYGLVA